MESTLYSIFGLLVLLGILVTFHEWGHYWVAKKLGVKALRFSVGFGKPFWSRFNKNGTEFAIAPIPLGGYVKFVDEREGDVAPEDLPYAFNRASVWKRILIVLAGPMANFLLAIVVYAITYMIGYQVAKPYIYSVQEGSIAAQSNFPVNSEILSVNGQKTDDFRAVIFALISELGEGTTAEIEILPDGSNVSRKVQLDLSNWNNKEADKAIDELGFIRGYRGSQFVIREISDGGAAKKAGLVNGDIIAAINGKSMNYHQTLDFIQQNPNQQIEAKIVRADKDIFIPITLGTDVEDQSIGRIGATVSLMASQDDIRTLKAGPLFALQLGAEKTWGDIKLTVSFFGKLLSNKLSISNMGSPISIAKGAGQTAQAGMVAFLLFLAMISVNLGFVNLLPIPVLDGGHLMYYLAELVRGKPVSEKIMELGMRIGIILVLSIMAIAVFYDINR